MQDSDDICVQCPIHALCALIRHHALQEADVREFWEECGAVEEADLMRFPDTGRFKGIAFITFAMVRPCWLASTGSAAAVAAALYVPAHVGTCCSWQLTRQ